MLILFVLILFFLRTFSQTIDPYEYNKIPFVSDRQLIVHLFDWKWSDIALECENFLQFYGYGGVQISPPQEHITIVQNDQNFTKGFPMYHFRTFCNRYAPVSYNLVSRSGNEDDFRDMVERCNKVGVRIIVDAVLNHVSGANLKLGDYGCGSSGGSYFDGTIFGENFPSVPYFTNDTHDKQCNRDISGSDYSSNLTNIKICRLDTLIDLNQTSPHVRDVMVGYLNHMIDIGVAGFRFDASEWMWPDDLRAILDGTNDLRSDIFGPNQLPLAIHEVHDDGTNLIKASDYTFTGRFTNFQYGFIVTAAARKQTDFGTLTTLGPGFSYGNLEDYNVLNFVDNHDSQRDDPPDVVTYKDGSAYKLAVGFMLAWPYGLRRVMSSFYFDNHDQGPPSVGPPNFNITSPIFDPNTKMCLETSGWVCEHRWPEIRNLVRFNQITSGKAVTAIITNRNALAFARESVGYFALNNNNVSNFTLNTQTTLPPGIYCDIYSGDIINNECTKTKIVVGGDGKASISVPPNSIVAFHVESRTDGPPPSLTPLPSSWQKTVILLKRVTQPGQIVFLRGGTNFNGACKPGPYMQNSDPCAIQISHTTNTTFVFSNYLSWSQNDDFLDFEGSELYQGTFLGKSALGTPLVWSTNDSNDMRYQPYNQYGPDYWLVEFRMNCTLPYQGWFEFKGYENENINWETNISQKNCTGNVGGQAPYRSINHIAKCGYVNIFEWDQNSCIINNL